LTRYRELADELAALITHGTLQVGERVPSVRSLVQQYRVSPATAMRAYEILESKDLIEARPRSGYYVSRTAEPAHSRPPSKSTRVEVSDLVFDILEATRVRDVVPLGSAFPSPLLFPWAKLARFLGSSARHMDPWTTVQSLPPGSEELRRQIARRYLLSGASVRTDEVVITSGALEALNLALATVTRPGDVIAIESPTFYACLQAVELAGLKAVEIPTHPGSGVDIGALRDAIAKHNIRACWFMTTFQNPLGATMPEERKKELVALLAKHEIPLIEDDVYAELYFGERPRSAKSFDRKGLVLNCGSFSKCLAPGYRIGWVAAGRFAKDIQRRKIISTLATSVPVQEGIAAMLRHDGLDGHLTDLRQALRDQQQKTLISIKRHFPAGVRVVVPDGGYFLWLELPKSADAMEIYRAALAARISVAPGPMFSARRAFHNCLRINCGHPFTADIDRAIAKLGKICGTAGSTDPPRAS
jgi:DNA-binding transcriptional MocR family regulator